MRVEVVVKLFSRPFVVIDSPVLVRFPCGYGAVSLASLNLVKKKTHTNRAAPESHARSFTHRGRHKKVKVTWKSPMAICGYNLLPFATNKEFG